MDMEISLDHSTGTLGRFFQNFLLGGASAAIVKLCTAPVD